jgi:hypothetical protein
MPKVFRPIPRNEGLYKELTVLRTHTATRNRRVLNCWQDEVTPCLINQAPRHDDVWGNACTAPPFLNSTLDGGNWLDTRPGHFTPAKREPTIHCVRGWVGPRAGLDAVKNSKTSCLSSESNSGHPARSPSLYRLSYSGSLLHLIYMKRSACFKAQTELVIQIS